MIGALVEGAGLLPAGDLPAWYWALTGVLLGGVLASFACVVVERVPRRQSLLGRSRCACGRALRPGENVPLLGWLRAGGTARCCGARIPGWYAASEALAMAAAGVAGWWAGAAGVAAALAAGAAVTAVVTARRRAAAAPEGIPPEGS